MGLCGQGKAKMLMVHRLPVGGSLCCGLGKASPKTPSHCYVGQEIMQAQDILCAEAPLNLGGLLKAIPDLGLPSPGNSEFVKKSRKNPSKTSTLIP